MGDHMPTDMLNKFWKCFLVGQQFSAEAAGRCITHSLFHPA